MSVPSANMSVLYTYFQVDKKSSVLFSVPSVHIWVLNQFKFQYPADELYCCGCFMGYEFIMKPWHSHVIMMSHISSPALLEPGENCGPVRFVTTDGEFRNDWLQCCADVSE